MEQAPSSERVRITALFSVDITRVTEVNRLIGQQLAQFFGGATLFGPSSGLACTGFWAEDGNEFKDRYSGQIHEEPLAGILLTVLKEDEDHAVDQLLKAIAAAVKQYKLDSRFIHIECHAVQARHADLQKYL